MKLPRNSLRKRYRGVLDRDFRGMCLLRNDTAKLLSSLAPTPVPSKRPLASFEPIKFESSCRPIESRVLVSLCSNPAVLGDREIERGLTHT